MLKPSDKWSWYYSDSEGYLMLDLGQEMVFRTNLSRNLLVDSAFSNPSFTVDDASDYQTYKERVSGLQLTEPRQVELALYCVAAKRFHKPVQPKSWFFDYQSATDIKPEEGDIVSLVNSFNQGFFIVLEVGESASLCVLIELAPFTLSSTKQLEFGQVIKVMHDRMSIANHILQPERVALVS
ncbi:cell division protein ZapC [Vibrio metschnikovii]|uniref:Cell division protein ZapC n=3 Tax=Unclassified Bacteria TaxID=49928 RepID=A0AAU6SU03_UNCXX|nr:MULTISPECIES: cell division protein ZapC [Vibrio]EKO3594726.1 cell division protein ZapC [Vibrio metschnikovii]EKO3599671.1 cell division protein ZapC [Vibrio metschnikovii]EKO3612782.1 cell division protein ZapC [Vibrio metschnikovii]EKO3616712.1 cell division protein ZapC [Vibrio metschnikovii]EKO3619638.1 cell division protein ZapC [Vibrio metschnikovii]